MYVMFHAKMVKIGAHLHVIYLEMMDVLARHCFTMLIVLQIDVGGGIYFWGLTIDTVTTINLLIAIGLTVDYSAHIAHTFMTQTGTRNGKCIRS